MNWKAKTVAVFVFVLYHLTEAKNPFRTMNLTIAWVDTPPYIFQSNRSIEPTGFLRTSLKSFLEIGCGNVIVKINHVQANSTAAMIEMLQKGLVHAGIPFFKLRPSSEIEDSFLFMKISDHPGSLYISKAGKTKFMSIVLIALLGSWPLLAFALICTAMSGIVIWALDSRSNSEEFPHSFIKGSWEGFWWAFVSMTTVGYGDKTPKSFLARVFSIWWIIFGVIVMAILVANISSVLTSLSLNTEKTSIEGVELAVLGNESQFSIAEDFRAVPIAYDTIDDMVQAVLSRDVPGMLLDRFTTIYYKRVKKFPSEFVYKQKLKITRQVGMYFVKTFKHFVECLQVLQPNIESSVKDSTASFRLKMKSDQQEIQLFSGGTDGLRRTVLWSLVPLVMLFVLGVLWDVNVRQRRKRRKSKDLESADNHGLERHAHESGADIEEEGEQLLKQLQDYIAKLQKESKNKPTPDFYKWRSFNAFLHVKEMNQAWNTAPRGKSTETTKN